MPSDWRDITLGTFVRLQRGHDLTESERGQGNVPVMGSAGQNGYHSEAKALGPGVVIGRSGASMGRVHNCPTDFWPHNTTLYVTDFLGNNPKFVYYFLKTLDLAGFNSGSAQPSLNRNYIYGIKICVPEREEQDSIQSILSAFDDKIALLRETNASLEAIAQALFKSWFVDFDPVRAKYEGRETEGVPPEVADLFPSEFKDSELGEIPKGWRPCALADHAVFQNGFAFKSKDWTDSGHPVVKIGDVKPGIIDLTGCSFVNPEVVSGLDKFKLRRGDLVVGMTGYVGETGLVPELFPNPYLNQRVGRISTKRGLHDIGYVYCLTRNPAFKTFAENQSHGSAQANVSGTALMSYPSLRMPEQILDSFNSILYPILDSILARHEEAQALASLRNSLLPKLMSGKLRLSEVASVVEDVT
jgi:type I restriction enzyme S subunit